MNGTTPARPRLVVLISGQGRNLQAILEAVRDGRIPAELAAVVSNNADAAGLERARKAGVPTVVVSHRDYGTREHFDAALAQAVERFGPRLVALAGFMRILGEGFTGRFPGRLLNIHPSLLPRYPGMMTHQRALAARDAEHGASVHYVTQELDGGPVVIQGRLTVAPQDTEQTLADRVMQDIELKIYPQALAWVARGELRCEFQQGHAQAWFRGRPLDRPLTLADLEAPFR